MATTQHKRFRPYGEPVWRTLIKADDRVTFSDVARLADTDYQRVVRMSRGDIATTDVVWQALAKLTGHSVKDLQEAVAIHMELIAEDGDRS